MQLPHEPRQSPRGHWYVQSRPVYWPDRQWVAIIGSRDASDEGKKRARQVTQACIEAGHIPVSGLAKGIDTVVHTTAQHEDAPQVAVVGTPLDEVYPAANRPLQVHIAQNDLLISPLGPEDDTSKQSFILRDRVMGRIVDYVYVVEAGPSSGTRHVISEADAHGTSFYFDPLVTASAGPGHYCWEYERSRTKPDT